MIEATQRRVLFVYEGDPARPMSSFILSDLELLRKHYEVEALSLTRYQHRHLGALLSPALWKMVARANLLFCWFGSAAPLVLMASILRRPSVVVAGGADVVHIPEIGYGLDRKDWLRFGLFCLGYRLATLVLLFSESSRAQFLRLPGASSKRSRTLYLGVDTTHFAPCGVKRNRVLTISYISEESIRRKGLATLLQVARLTPEIPYRVGGLVIDEAVARSLAEGAPPNVTFLGTLDDEQLLAELRCAKVYAQLSYHEGFGMALAEAMACECIPVVTDRGSIPELVGDAGFYVPLGECKATAAAIREALHTDAAGLGRRARERIVKLFSVGRRQEGILAALRHLARS